MKYFESNYIVYSDGRIYSLKYKKFLKPMVTNKKYHRVNLNGKVYSVHRLIAQIFIPNFNNFPQVNHINGIKSDNRVENLEWVTNRQNVIYFHNSKFPGVEFRPSGKFSARVRILKERFYLGTYNTPEEAYNVIKSFLAQHNV